MDQRSKDKLSAAHPDLQRVVYRCAADSDINFFVTECMRSVERQRELVKAGASKTMNSRHIPDAEGIVHAVDLAIKVGEEVRWDWPLYEHLAEEMKFAAKLEGVEIEWGGDWKMRDGPHYQLPWSAYP